jgi:hypothetical protein
MLLLMNNLIRKYVLRSIHNNAVTTLRLRLYKNLYMCTEAGRQGEGWMDGLMDG